MRRLHPSPPQLDSALTLGFSATVMLASGRQVVGNICFISYRRATSAFVARAVFQDLRAHRIDVFFDVEAIDQGDFRTVIDSQIRARPYFLPILSPAALKRCLEPDDLLCKEFATAVLD